MTWIKDFFTIITDSLLPRDNSDKNPTDYLDLGSGLPWFADFHRNKKLPTLTEFFGLNKANEKKITATIDKVAFYHINNQKYFALTAKYYDNDKQKEFVFYCPGFEYDPTEDYKKGTKLEMVVDMLDYSKYEMPVY